MRPLHARLVREAKQRDPKFEVRPLTAKSLEPIAERLGVVPEDYAAFLLEVGRLPGTLRIGHPSDFDAAKLPEDFVPFAEDDVRVYGFIEPDDLEPLDDEELEDDEPFLLIGSLRKADGSIAHGVETFAEWLERATKPKPKVAAAKAAAALPVAPPDDPNVARALHMLDVLLATKKLEVDASFDENACAKKLASCLDDAEEIADVLVDVRGVVELYATEDDIEVALSGGED